MPAASTPSPDPLSNGLRDSLAMPDLKRFSTLDRPFAGRPVRQE
jgi:hypothetical protein